MIEMPVDFGEATSRESLFGQTMNSSQRPTQNTSSLVHRCSESLKCPPQVMRANSQLLNRRAVNSTQPQATSERPGADLDQSRDPQHAHRADRRLARMHSIGRVTTWRGCTFEGAKQLSLKSRNPYRRVSVQVALRRFKRSNPPRRLLSNPPLRSHC